MFPTTLDGEIDLAALDPGRLDSVLSNIERALAAENATVISRTETRIAFENNIFRMGTGWNVLAAIAYGEFVSIPGSPSKVKYSFSFKQSLILVSVLASIVSAIVTSRSQDHGFSAAFSIFMILWSAGFGINYFIGAARLPRFVRRAIGI